MFWVTSEDAKLVKINAQSFQRITLFREALRPNPNGSLSFISVGFVECNSVSFNCQQVTFIGDTFDAKKLLNFESLREYIQKTTARQFIPGLTLLR